MSEIAPTQETSPTQFGSGKPTEVSIDKVNIAMRAMPWYQELIKSFGQDPNNVRLNDSQKQQVLRGAKAAGIQVNEGDMEVDPAGNFNPKGHKLRNTLIVAGIAAATIATMGAAGAFSGAGAAGMAGGASGAGAAGAGGAGAAGLGFGTVGLGAGGVGGAGAIGTGFATGLGGAAAGLGGTAASIAPLASTAIGSGAMSAPIAGGTGMAGGAANTAGGTVMSRMLNPKNLADLASVAQGFGNQEASNRETEGQFSQNYDRNMIQAQQDRRTNESDAMKKLTVGGYILGGGSKYKAAPLTLNNKTYAPVDNGIGPPPISEGERAGAATLQEQLLNRLKPEGSYTPQPLSGYAKPGTAEKIGNWGQTALGVGGTIANIMGYGR